MDTDALREAVVQLGQRGAARWAPVEYTLARALVERVDDVPQEVALHLVARLAVAIESCETVMQRRRSTARPAAATPRARCTALAELTASLTTRHSADAAIPQGPSELASAARFREAWARQQALDRIGQAQARRPANAGPLNSHALALECLTLMRELSPDYLRHFVQQFEALQRLAQWQAEMGTVAAERGKPAKAAKTAKARAPRATAGRGKAGN